jgi:DNA-binding HxlR family transcriptional regulator
MADPMKRLPMLPVERALKVISGRWKAVILYSSSTAPSACRNCRGAYQPSPRRC